MKKNEEALHPKDRFLNPDAFPTDWCSGCGIGTALYTLFEAAKEMGIQSQLAVFSGTGCTGKIVECLSVSAYSAGDGFAVAAAAEWNQKNVPSKTVVFLNNADLLLTGAQDLLEAGKNQNDLVVIIINNLIYNLSGERAYPLTPFMRPSPACGIDLPFNIPLLAQAVGAGLAARWNPLRAGWMRHTLIDALSAERLSVVEMISPCVVFRADSKEVLSPVERMSFLNDFSEMAYVEPSAELDLRRSGRIILGRFIPREEKDYPGYER